jgi:hypothetical protein
MAVNRGQRVRTTSLPAPVGGYNTRDAYAAMDPIYFSGVENWFPQPSCIEVRKGFASQTTQTGLNSTSSAAGFVKYGETSLWVGSYKQSTSELILKDIVGGTTQTISGHAVLYAPSYTQFANSAGTFVAAVFRNNDATNNYYTYDGTTWTARTAATTNSQSFKFVASFRNRLWFLTDASGKNLSVYYLPTSAITGTTVEFPLGGVASKGGTLYGIGTWTRDGGTGGSDDLIVFTTTAGQAIVYAGTDPSSASTFALVGVFDMPRFVGKPFKFGSDLLMPCEDGLYSMNQVLGGNIGPEFAISHILRSRWQALALDSISNASANTIPERVSLVYSPKFTQLMVFFRSFGTAGAVTCRCLVMNTVTKAWTAFGGTSFQGYNVDALAGDIYFANITGGNTATVYKFGTATSDPDGAITATGTQAFTTLGMPGTNKIITAVRPSVASVGGGGNSTLQVNVGNNYNVASFITGSTETIGTAFVSPVLSCPALGTSIALQLNCTLSTGVASPSLQLFATDVLFVPGGPV